MYLIIDTSNENGGVGVWLDGVLTRVLAWRSRNNHTSELMPAVDAVLAGAGASPSDLTGVAVTTGPGGFSAMRTGLGVAKGLAFALSVPVAGISTLEATAYPHRDAGFPVCAVIEAGRDNVGWARFQLTDDGWRRRTPDRVTPAAKLLAASGRHTLFCGEGASAHADRLREAMGVRAHLAGEPAAMGRLQGLAELGAAQLDAGDGRSPAELEPHYLRSPEITQPKQPQPVRYGALGKRL